MGVVIASGVLAVLVVLTVVRVVRRERREPLGHCPLCAADAVSSVEREAVDQTQAVLELRCGGCGTWRRIMTSAGAARLLDLRIERQCRVIRDAAERLERARMASDADAFRAALRSEIDGAEDFLARTRATSSL